MRIKGVEFRRGYFKPDMFPHLRLANQVLHSRETLGIGVRMCAGFKSDEIELFCNEWQPTMCKEMSAWHPIRTLEYLDRFVFRGIDLRISHGVCPVHYATYMDHLDGAEVLPNGVTVKEDKE